MAQGKTDRPLFTLAASAALVAMLVLAVAAPVLGTLHWLRGNEIERLESQLTAAQASSRSAWQKVYDLQEQHEDAATTRENQLQVELWQVKQKLEQCKP